MPTLLNEELQLEVARQGDRPIQLVDPTTAKRYVLVSADVFERVRSLLGEPFDIRDTYAAQDAALAKIWNDPLLDEYAEYDRHKSKP